MKRTPLKRKTALRKQSPKRAKEARVYAKKRQEFLEANPECMTCRVIYTLPPYSICAGAFGHEATQVHHRELRGPKYLDESTWIGTCQWAHTWIHDHPNKARALGLLK